MNQPSDSLTNDELDLTMETLDRWEAELDEFAMHIVHRLSTVSSTGDPTIIGETSTSDGNELQSEDQQTLDLLRSIRELNQ